MSPRSASLALSCSPGGDWLEPNRRLAIIFKCAILAAGGAAIANQLLQEGMLAAIDMSR
jgi:hypothetical protein